MVLPRFAVGVERLVISWSQSSARSAALTGGIFDFSFALDTTLDPAINSREDLGEGDIRACARQGRLSSARIPVRPEQDNRVERGLKVASPAYNGLVVSFRR